MKYTTGCVKKRKFRHSSTFYRKVKSEINKLQSKDSATSNVIIASDNPSPYILTNNVENVQPSTFLNCENSECVSEDVCSTTFDKSQDISVPEISKEEEDEVNKNIADDLFNEELRKWCIHFKVTHQAINKLLGMHRAYGHKNLPADSRTFLKTVQNTDITNMGDNGQFWYHGVEKCLLNVLTNIQAPTSLSLVFNIDGLPPFRSAPIEFWPILVRIAEFKETAPMVVAIYCGQSKPPLQQFFAKFVQEMLHILNNGIECKGNKVTVKIKYFVCDTPARCFIKGTVGFNAAHGCIKCTTIGKYDKIGRHMSFPDINSVLRTDEGFRLKMDNAHHKEDSPLVGLPIHMIDTFIIADSLHLFDLGIMRKCLNGWIHGSHNFRKKLSATQIEAFSEELVKCNSSRPNEIHRAIRKLKHLKFWKGVEYRTFLLYLGPVLLKNYLSKDIYEHFLQLFCAVTIVSCSAYRNYLAVADQLFKDYIENYSKIYGIDSIGSNVHNICHLSEISSYPFENHLAQIKLLLRTGNRPLAQIVKRLSEIEQCQSAEQINIFPSCFPSLSGKINVVHDIPSCEGVFCKFIMPLKYQLSCDPKNKWFLSTSNEIVGMINATYFKKEIYIYGAKITNKHDFFSIPIKSSVLNIYCSKLKLASPKLYHLKKIKCKLFAVNYKNENAVFFPLLHTYYITDGSFNS